MTWNANERWQAFQTTVFDVSSTDEARLREAPVFGIVTAHNPGRILRPAQNAARDRALRESLIERELDHARVVGRSPDGTHREPGWAIIAPRDVAVEIGREQDQDAVFVVEGGEVLLVPCRGGPEGDVVRLGPWSERTVRIEPPSPPPRL